MTRRTKQLLAAAFLLIVILISVRASDKLSCDRSNSVRHSQIGYQHYALDAAYARERSAAVEAGRNPTQAAIDRQAAAAFRRDAAATTIHLISCGGVFPTGT